MDQVSRAKLAAVVAARLSYGEAKTANALIDDAHAALDGLRKFGISLVVEAADAVGDPDLAKALSDAHPALQVSAEFPKWLYHNDQPALVVNDKDEEAALGDGWHPVPQLAVTPVAMKEGDVISGAGIVTGVLTDGVIVPMAAPDHE